MMIILLKENSREIKLPHTVSRAQSFCLCVDVFLKGSMRTIQPLFLRFKGYSSIYYYLTLAFRSSCNLLEYLSLHMLGYDLCDINIIYIFLIMSYQQDILEVCFYLFISYGLYMHYEHTKKMFIVSGR